MKHEPVILAMLLRVVPGLLAAYGLEISAEQLATIWAAIEVVLAVVVRARVTSEATLAGR